MAKFKLTTNLTPQGDQAQAIKSLVEGAQTHPLQALLGITGSGKTFTVANVINQLNKPTLVLAHNKILAYQLYKEFKDLFPYNHVEYFISYFDYYQPESYMPQTDTYIEKDSLVNKEIERLRLKSAAALLSHDDVIIVSSISCIYGMGNPQDWRDMSQHLALNQKIDKLQLAKSLIALQYERNDIELQPGRFRMKGDTIDIMLSYDQALYRVILDNGTIIRITQHDPVTQKLVQKVDNIYIFPAKQYVIPSERMQAAYQSIKNELATHAPTLGLLERERLTQRTNYDLDMMREMGYCNGIENYSAHFEGRSFGTPPSCLLDFFPKDFLLVIDESHQTIPQAGAMYHGDYARKKNLVEHGFRLPSDFSNRPLKFGEFETYFNQVIFVSATPGPYELEHATNHVEQIIRPTGLLDPIIEMRTAQNQVDDLLGEIKKVIRQKERVLVSALTKKTAEDLTDYLVSMGIKAQYMHSEIEALQRVELIRQLRLGSYDVLVGINLLREGLDIPEVALVAILDADKLGFLRDARSLIQTTGRAARNQNGKVILYADRETSAITETIQVTQNRRLKQIAHNQVHNITPKTIIKNILAEDVSIQSFNKKSSREINLVLNQLKQEMQKAASDLDFEKAIMLRDKIHKLQYLKNDKA
jgi:excinuclease ABC subunit B